jgi:NAD(P)-dependent dehydrogenase (short-subunit alcohol dehydrogenase family)
VDLVGTVQTPFGYSRTLATHIKDLTPLLERALTWNEGGCKYGIVVVNAGRGLAGDILSSDESQWQDLYQTNVLGAAHLMWQAGRYLLQRNSGDIVVIGSAVGRNISPFSSFSTNIISMTMRIPAPQKHNYYHIYESIIHFIGRPSMVIKHDTFPNHNDI